MDGAEYGAYCACEWKHAAAYYGSGESFLFSVGGSGSSSGRGSNSGRNSGNGGGTSGADSSNLVITPFKWTGMNTLFQFSNDDQLAIGGGGGGFGLLLKDDFDIAESLPCETYGNTNSLDIRNDSGTSSKVCNVELWTFQLSL